MPTTTLPLRLVGQVAFVAYHNGVDSGSALNLGISCCPIKTIIITANPFPNRAVAQSNEYIDLGPDSSLWSRHQFDLRAARGRIHADLRCGPDPQSGTRLVLRSRRLWRVHADRQ